ncbi:MAG: insulinase family protein, partial [Lachnospiraceae bacterium]|nr:insulinase family protein [Lachnospiraceae bacterium]
PEQKEEFLKIYHDVLQGLVKNGLEKKSLLAALNYYEFRFREADFGGSPKGLYLGLDLLDTWIFDETKPFLHLETFGTFDSLRKKIDERYFENLITTYLLNNTFASFVMLVPKKGLQEQREKELADKCRRYKESLSKEEIDELVRKTAELKAYQETEDTPEALACIPHLKREDLKKNAELPVNELREESGLKVLYHELPTNGIGYLRLQFNANDVAVEDLPYLGLLKSLMGLLNTDRYTYGELFNEIHLHSGGMSVNAGVMEGLKNVPGEYDVFVSVRIKALYNQMQKAAELLENMIMHTDFRQYKRIEEILAENYSGLQSDFLAAGHSAAARRAGSYLLPTSAAGELIGGLEQFRLVEDLHKHFEEKKELISEKMEGLCRLIFRPENLMIDYASEEKGYEVIRSVAYLFMKKLFTVPVTKLEKRAFAVPVKANEAFTSASQVNYVAMAGDFRKKGLVYTGVLKAVKVLMSYDYLWNQVRVLGGAYGCFGDFGRLGTCFVVSYRDPHVKRTLDIYKAIAEYIESFEDSPENEEKLTQYIISAIGDLDTPKTPRLKADYSYSCYMFGMTDELIQQERDELLGATPAAVRKCADYVRAMVEADSICAFGNEEKLKEHQDLFGSVAPLFS